jgi:hypothetical protein
MIQSLFVATVTIGFLGICFVAGPELATHFGVGFVCLLCVAVIWSSRKWILPETYWILMWFAIFGMLISIFLSTHFSHGVWMVECGCAMWLVVLTFVIDLVERSSQKRFLKYLAWFNTRYEADKINHAMLRGGYSKESVFGRIEFLNLSEEDIEKIKEKPAQQDKWESYLTSPPPP